MLSALGGSMILLNYRGADHGLPPCCGRRWGAWGGLSSILWLRRPFCCAVHFTAACPGALPQDAASARLSVVVLVESAGKLDGGLPGGGGFALVLYPVLRLLEGWQGYDDLFVQRRAGEGKEEPADALPDAGGG